jgi:hypothetical protein
VKSIAGVCLAFVLLSGAAAAQSRTETPGRSPVGPTDARQQSGLRLPVLLWAGAVAADQITTYQFSSQYRDVLHERNPVIRGLDRHPALLVTAGTALDVATAWAASRVLQRHPRVMKVVFYGAAFYRSYLAFYNIEMMHNAQAMRTTR